MRKIVAALQMSVDGFIEGPNGELDWVASWEDPFDMLPEVDACILGRKMYAGYEQYWQAVLDNPKQALPFTGKPAGKGEIVYARFASKTPHMVLSKTLDKAAWKNTRIVRDVQEIRDMKRQQGKDIYAVGGATLVSSLLNHDLVDELRLAVQPVVLGGGTALFKDVKERHRFKLAQVKRVKSEVRLTYRKVA